MQNQIRPVQKRPNRTIFGASQKIIRLLAVLCGVLPLAPSQGYGTPPARQSGPMPGVVVCIDPGHPSEVNRGSEVQNGTSEVHVAWVVALKLRQLLLQAGVPVVMTKTRENEMVPNRERAMIANRAGAALMVRLHCDTGRGSGFALYYPDRAGHKDGVVGPSRAVMEASHEAARIIHQGMAEVLRGLVKDNGVRGESQTFIGARQGALTGSIFARVPAVTIEMVVLANRRDAAFIKSQAGVDRMARAIDRGVLVYSGIR